MVKLGEASNYKFWDVSGINMGIGKVETLTNTFLLIAFQIYENITMIFLAGYIRNILNYKKHIEN